MPSKKTTLPINTTTSAPAPAKKAAKKAAAKKAPAKKAAKTAAEQPVSAKPAPAPKAAPKASPLPSHEEIAKAAYLNFRSRKEKGEHGDPHGDWLAAERKLKGK